MSTLTLFWIGVGIMFLIVELMTVAFYGLSLAISAFFVAIYVAAVGIDSVDLMQGIIFVVSSIIMAFILPRWLTPEDKEQVPQGLDIYIGQAHRVHKIDGDAKIYLDGVQFMVSCDDELQEKDLVKILKRQGSVFVVEKI